MSLICMAAAPCRDAVSYFQSKQRIHSLVVYVLFYFLPYEPTHVGQWAAYWCSLQELYVVMLEIVDRFNAKAPLNEQL